MKYKGEIQMKQMKRTNNNYQMTQPKDTHSGDKQPKNTKDSNKGIKQRKMQKKTKTITKETNQ